MEQKDLYQFFNKMQNILNPSYYEIKENNTYYGDYFLKYKGQSYDITNICSCTLKQKKDKPLGFIDTIVDFMYKDFLFFKKCHTNRLLTNSVMTNVVRVLTLHLNIRFEFVGNEKYLGIPITFKDPLGYTNYSLTKIKQPQVPNIERSRYVSEVVYNDQINNDYNIYLKIKKLFFIVLLELLDIKIGDIENMLDKSLNW